MRPITDFLIEFPRAMPLSLAGAARVEAEREPAAPTDAEVLDLAVAEARQAGLDEGLARGASACDQRLTALRETHAAEMLLARARWAANEGDVLGKALRDGLGRLEDAIATGVATVLMPLLEEALRARAARELAEAVGQLLAGGHGTAIEVCGAGDLLGPVQAAFADNPAVEVNESDKPELSVTAGDTLIVSQIEAWSERLRAALQAASEENASQEIAA